MTKHDYQRWNTIHFSIAFLCAVLAVIGIIVLVISLINSSYLWVGPLFIVIALVIFIINLLVERKAEKYLIK